MSQPSVFRHRALTPYVIDETDPNLTMRQVSAGQTVIESCLAGLRTLYGSTTSVSEDELRLADQWVKVQRHHLRQYTKMPHNPDLPEVNRRIGGMLDRSLQTATNIVELSCAVIRGRRNAEWRRYERRRREYLRAQRIASRKRQRALEAEQQRALAEHIAREHKQPKRKKRPVVERCTKCNKRPRARGMYCAPCAEWEQNHSWKG